MEALFNSLHIVRFVTYRTVQEARGIPVLANALDYKDV
jgi:hypothetical protein